MSTEKTQLLDEAFHFTIIVDDKRAKPTKLLLDVLNTLRLKVTFIDEVDSGELELKSVDNALSNTPAVLVLISEELTGNARLVEFLCMGIEKYLKSCGAVRMIPVYVPNKSRISYFNELPTYITNKVGISLDPGCPEEFAQTLRSRVLSAKWYRTALSKLSKRVECKENETTAPSPNYVTTQQRANVGNGLTDFVCEVSGDCEDQAISSMTVECDLNSRSTELSKSQERVTALSTPEVVLSENVLKHWTDHICPLPKNLNFHTVDTDTSKVLECIRDKRSTKDKTNVPLLVASLGDGGIQTVSSMVAACSLGGRSFTMNPQDGIDTVPIPGSIRDSGVKQNDAGTVQRIIEKAPFTDSSNLPLDHSSSSSNVGKHTGEESPGQFDTNTTWKIMESTQDKNSDRRHLSLNVDGSAVLKTEAEVKELDSSISHVKAYLYRDGTHTKYDSSHFYLPPMLQVNNTPVQVPSNSKSHAEKQATETECSFQSTF